MRNKLFILFAVALFTSCVKDLADDVNKEGWNHEHSIISLKFENQIGSAVIDNLDNETGDINLSINVGAQPSMSSVKITEMELSYQAEASVKVGDALDFSGGTATIKVVSTMGEERVYTIYAESFIETLEGEYSVDALTIYGGTGPEYGGGAVMQLSDKPWCWRDATAPQKECDNTLTFKMTGVSEDGNTTGTCVNNAGPDGTYADFVFLGAMNKEGTDDIDLKKFYRQIPEGESTWIRNYSEGTITFIDKNGNTTVGKFLNSQSIDCGYGKSFTVINNAFQFTLNGTDDWTNIYSDYDKFVKRPRFYWISVTKKN